MPESRIDPAFLQPWLIRPEWLQAAAVSEGQALTVPAGTLTAGALPMEPGAVAAYQGQPVGESNLVEMRGNVAVIHVRGPIIRYESLYSRFFRVVPVEALAKDFRAAIDDPSVKAILLDIDSPGGTVGGIHEMGEMIFQVRQKKPVTAYVGGSGASAAYWLATAASEMVIDATAEVGSIGVVTVFVDYRQMDEKFGIKEIEIVSSSSPKKRPDPATDAGRKQIQGWLDALCDVFIGAVARNRGVSDETVRSEFGQGDIRVGKAAVESGMADRLGSFEEVLAELQGKSTSQREGMFMAETITRETIAKDHPEIAEAFRKEGREAGLKEGAELERGRIKGIEALGVPGHDCLIAKLKFEEPVSAEQAAMRILEAEKVQRGKVAKDLATDAAAVAGVAPDPANVGTDAEAKGKALDAAMVQGGNSRRR